MKKTIIISSIIVAIAVIVSTIIFTKKEDTVTINPERTAKTFLKDGFMDGCLKGGEASYTQCDCMFEELYLQYGEKKFVDMSLKYSETGELPEDFANTVLRCL